jgi:hypothetical protein
MDRDEWLRRYEGAGSTNELARRVGLCAQTVRKRLRAAGIEIKKTGFRSPKSVTYSGPAHTSWKGGTYRHTDGYVYEYAPNHPAAATAKGYVLQHRLVMERKLGRLLRNHEVVHHLNEVKHDNRPENLELTSRSVHMQGHKAGTARDCRGRFLE